MYNMFIRVIKPNFNSSFKVDQREVQRDFDTGYIITHFPLFVSFVCTTGSPMRCFPNVSQVDNKSSSPPAYNDIVKGGEVSLQKRDENASEEEGAEELRLVGDLSVAEVDVVKRFSIDMPRGNVDCDVVVIG